MKWQTMNLKESGGRIYARIWQSVREMKHGVDNIIILKFLQYKKKAEQKQNKYKRPKQKQKKCL